MRSIRQSLVLIPMFMAVTVIAGCQSARPVVTNGIRPPTTENVKEARFHQAIEGLNFETGFVVVDQIGRQSNTRLASKLHVEGVEAYNQNRIIDAITCKTRRCTQIRRSPGRTTALVEH